jgi:hypothetical protein
LGRDRADPRNYLETISIGEIDIDDDEGGIDLCNLRKPFRARSCLEYLKFLALLESFTNATSHDSMIINDERNK